MDPPRLLTAIGIKKDGERGEKKKKTVHSLLDIIIPGPAWAGDHWGRTKSHADVSVLRQRVPLAE